MNQSKGTSNLRRAGALLWRMICGGETVLSVLLSLKPQAPVIIPTHKIADVVEVEVQSVQAIDHTHLFPLHTEI